MVAAVIGLSAFCCWAVAKASGQGGSGQDDIATIALAIVAARTVFWR